MTTRFCLIGKDTTTIENTLTIYGDIIGIITTITQAETKILQLRPEIIIMDIELPTVDQGLSFLTFLKENNCTSDIIIISSVTDKAIIDTAYTLGINFFIIKPVSPIELSAVLNNLITTQQQQKILHTIASTISGLPNYSSNNSLKHSREQAAQQVLANLGILGEPGAKDLLNLIKLTSDISTLTVSEMCLKLSAYYQELTPHGISWQPKAIEQRLRRAILVSLKHIASLGLEDYNDPQTFAPYSLILMKLGIKYGP